MHSSSAGDFWDFSLFRELADLLTDWLFWTQMASVVLEWIGKLKLRKNLSSLWSSLSSRSSSSFWKNKNWPTRKKIGENPSVSVNVYFCLQLASIAAKVHLFGDWRSHFGEDRQSSATVALCRQSDSLPLHPSSTVLSPTELPLSLCMHTHTHSLTDSLNCTDFHLHNGRCTEERKKERERACKWARSCALAPVCFLTGRH